MKSKILLVSLLAIFSVSCCRYHDYPYGEEPDGQEWVEATVVYMGAPEVDGCGWLIQIEDEYYYPVNLSERYLVEGLPVRIRYTYDPIEFRCGRGGVRYPSIRISEIRVNAPEVKQLYREDWDRVPMDGFRMDSAFVEGDYLHLLVSYGGGCRDHDFDLWRLPSIESERDRIELMLAHDANDDMCEAYITEWKIFSLKPLRQRETREVTFLLRGSPEMSSYFGRFVYRY